MFRLPEYEELSKEQDAIHNLPLSGTHLVIGPPGTGKTVLAIYRAKLYHRAQKKSKLIVYNNTLQQYLGGATGDVGITAKTNTWHSWFCKWHWDTFRRFTPEIRPFVYDWSEIWRNLAAKEAWVTRHRLDHLIIDEGQDLPKEAFGVFRMLAKDLTVFADENQRITDHNSTIEEIKAALGVEKPRLVRRNYRNTEQIARFAAMFYAGLQTEIADIPESQGNKPRVVPTGDCIQQEAQLVAQYAKRYRRHDIGVLLPRTDQQRAFERALKRSLIREGIGTRVQMYISGDQNYDRVDFSQPDVKIINYQSAKGLEFDAVFMPRVDMFGEDPRSDGTKMKFYTMTSRAREWLYIMYTGPSLPTVLEHIPSDLYDVWKP